MSKINRLVRHKIETNGRLIEQSEKKGTHEDFGYNARWHHWTQSASRIAGTRIHGASDFSQPGPVAPGDPGPGRDDRGKHRRRHDVGHGFGWGGRTVLVRAGGIRAGNRCAISL